MVACGVITTKGSPCTFKLNTAGKCRVPKHNAKKIEDDISQLTQSTTKLLMKDMKLQNMHEVIVACDEPIEVNIDGCCEGLLHTSTDKSDQTEINSDSYESDHEISYAFVDYLHYDPNPDSENEEEEEPIIDDYESDDECVIEPLDGYESEHDDLDYEIEFKHPFTSIESDYINSEFEETCGTSFDALREAGLKEQEEARIKRLIEEERLRAIESHQRAIDAIAERKEREQADRDARTLVIATEAADMVTIVDDEGTTTTTHDKWDLVYFPPDPNELNINRVWNDQEIHDMRDNKWYKLCALLPRNLSVIDIQTQLLIRYAFKRETSLNDDQRYWMIVDLYNTILNHPMESKAMMLLQEDIRIKMFCRPEEYEDMHATWVQIKKLIKSKNASGFALWEKARKQEVRQIKIDAEANVDATGLNSFIAGITLGSYKASDLYDLYLTKKPSDVLTVRQFGVALNKRGIKTKSVKLNKKSANCYVLTAELVSTFLSSC